MGQREVVLASARERTPMQILVSGVVTPLVVGTGLDFADSGDHELKGVPGAWRLFAVER